MLEDAKAWSEIFSNVAMPIATVVAAVVGARIVVRGAEKVGQRVIEARGAIGPARTAAPQGSAAEVP